MKNIIDRFISYVSIDTQSDSSSETTPSTKKQWNLANKLAEELKTIGMEEVTIDDKAYIMATLSSNVDTKYLQLVLFRILTPHPILQVPM